MKLMLMLNCNDHRNGSYRRRFDSCDLSCEGMDAMLSLTGPWLRTFADKEKLSVGRVRVPHHGESKWVGNWCWNGYVLTMKASAFVLSHLRERRFTPEYGIDPLFPLWHEREITIDDLKAVFRS